MNRSIFRLGLLSLLALGAIPAQAGVIIGPTSISTDMGSLDGTYTIANTANQSGLSATYTSNSTDFDTFVASVTSNNQQASPRAIFQAASGVKSGNVFVDLGATFTIEKMALWNAITASGFRVAQMTVYEADSSYNTLSTIGTFNTTGAGGTTTAAQAEVFTFSAPISLQYLKIAMTNAGTGQVVFNELVFGTGLAAVPEPSTWVSLSAVAVIGLTARLRRGNRSR